jgi:hypothetical protein
MFFCTKQIATFAYKSNIQNIFLATICFEAYLFSSITVPSITLFNKTFFSVLTR